MYGTTEFAGRKFPIIDYVDVEGYGRIPMIDIPQMSDYRWQQICLEKRLANPEYFAKREDVEATIAYLRKWLAEHEPEGHGERSQVVR